MFRVYLSVMIKCSQFIRKMCFLALTGVRGVCRLVFRYQNQFLFYSKVKELTALSNVFNKKHCFFTSCFRALSVLRAWRFQPSSSNSGCQSRQHTKTGRGLSLTTSLDANGNTFARKKNIPLLLCVHTEIICNSMAQYKAEERNSCFYRCVCVCVHTCSVYMCFIVLNTLSVLSFIVYAGPN